VRRALVASTFAALVVPGSAPAHGPDVPRSGYVANVSAVTPNILGVFVNVVGGDERLRLSNYSGKTIVILGYQDEPYLRFERSGVFENARSPAAFLNRYRNPRGLRPTADPAATPLWRRVSAGASFAWRDHRIHWLRRKPPPGVQREPKKIQLVFRWRVPGIADGEPFAITGVLGYAPPRKGGNGSGWIVPAAGVAAAAFIAAATGAVLLEARRRSRRRASASG